MKIKLTRREPTDDMEEAAAAEYDKIADWNYREQVVGTAPWQAAHDAAPDDATKALVELVRELGVYRRAREQRNIELGAQRIERVMSALDRLSATPEGAEFIRQAEERE